jgi:tRNA1Val (adenine37-N6)-methyltransferase
MSAADPPTTDGHLLGGRVRYAQPAAGFRSGVEPVLLAASIPARPHERVLESGTGAGAALLCLAARVPAIQAVGVEADAGLARLAAVNAQVNGFGDMRIVTDRIETVALAGPFDHALANPPYHAPGGSNSPDAAREAAKRGSEALLRTWIDRLGRSLRDRGSLTLILPAGMVPVCLAAMTDCHTPCTTLFPLWPKTGRPAKLVLLRGIRRGRTPMRLMPGLVLHRPDGAFTDSAQAILRDGQDLAIDRHSQPQPD